MDATSTHSTLRRAIARLVTAMMVADRRLSTDELDQAARLDHIGLGPLSPLVQEELQRAARIPIDLREACLALSGTGPALIGTVLSALADVAASDGTVDDDERRVFTVIADRLGARRCRLEDYLHADDDDGGTDTSAPAVADVGAAGENALRALGLRATARRADVDEAYLRVVEQYDPAKVAPLGADFVALAVRKLAALTDLYGTAREAAKG